MFRQDGKDYDVVIRDYPTGLDTNGYQWVFFHRIDSPACDQLDLATFSSVMTLIHAAPTPEIVKKKFIHYDHERVRQKKAKKDEKSKAKETARFCLKIIRDYFDLAPHLRLEKRERCIGTLEKVGFKDARFFINNLTLNHDIPTAVEEKPNESPPKIKYSIPSFSRNPMVRNNVCRVPSYLACFRNRKYSLDYYDNLNMRTRAP